ncbi:MAG: type II pantothenate kinase [Clostridia bacterium]|nr:type II pantothenate kinase [Clostridia bacterium]
MVTIGIDIGGSTTKIVGFSSDKSHTLIEPLSVRATDPVTSVYGAFGKFITQNNLELDDIEKVSTTGVGSKYITKPLYSLPCENVPEFRCIGLGGLYLSGLEEAIVVSMGTGTALVHANRNGKNEYLGGTGVGGGTLVGLSERLIGVGNVEHISALAEKGNLDSIDLRIKDITPGSYDLPSNMTAANFGKVSELATKEDLALGLVNMIYETVGMMAVFNSRMHGTKDIVLTGNLTQLSQAPAVFKTLSDMFNVNFIIPDRAQYSTVIGAALCALT